MTDEDRERMRAMAYNAIVDNPSHPNADKIRAFLSALPKIKTGRDIDKLLQLSGTVGDMKTDELSGGDLGSELPPTADEDLGIDKGLKKPGIGTRAAVTLGSQAGRRQLERGLSDSITLGAASKVAGSLFPEEFGPDAEFADAEAAGYAPREAGQLFGALMPGATRGVFNAFHTPLTALASRAPGIAGKAVAGAAAGAGTMAGAAPVISGAQTLINGDPEHVFSNMKESATNPVNLAVGAGAGLLGGVAEGIRQSPGQAGRDIRFVESYDATPTPFGGAKGGIFETPLLKDVGSSSRETGMIASKAGKHVVSGLDAEEKAIQNEYRQAVGEAGDLGQLDGMVRPDAVIDAANRMMGSMRLTKAQRAEIQGEVLDVLNQHPNGLTVQAMNEFKQKLQEMSGGEGPLVELGKAAKGAIDETEMGPINLKYHQGMEGLRRKRGLLNLKGTTEPRLAEDRVARHILNRGENVGGAGIQEPDVEAFVAENPRYKTMFDAVSAMNARGRMGATLMPEGGGLLHRLGNIVGHNIEPAMVGAYRLGQTVDANALPLTLVSRFLLGNQLQGDTE